MLQAAVAPAAGNMHVMLGRCRYTAQNFSAYLQVDAEVAWGK